MQRRTVFDAVRRMLGRGFRRAEVAALDRAIDAALGDAGEDAHTQPHSIGPDGVALIKRFEGCGRQRSDGMVEAYPDPGTGGDPWTIGWGATGAGIGPGTVWTRAQCDERLACDLERYAADVARAIGDAPTSQRQFDAPAFITTPARWFALRCYAATSQAMSQGRRPSSRAGNMPAGG